MPESKLTIFQRIIVILKSIVNQKSITLNIIVYSVLLILWGCSTHEKEQQQTGGGTNAYAEVWFKQAGVDLGNRICMFSENHGFAVSSGKGNDVNGKVLEFQNGKWNTVDEFEYSDFPQASFYNGDIFWYIIHETHHGNYKPHLYSFKSEKKSEIILPPIMWDKKDFSMWTGLATTPSGKAFLVGQQGNIIYFDGKKWNIEPSPVKKKENQNFLSGDLEDIQMLSDTSGWAVGKQGIVLKLTKGKWIRYNSPTDDELNSISMADENFGWIVGDRGTILKYTNGTWKKDSSDVRILLHSVKTVNREKAWAVGQGSTLLEYNNGKWTENNSIKIFEDIFHDIDVVKDKNGEYKIWIIGENGIYSNSQNLKFSFTDVTAQASIRKEGKAGIFRDFNDDALPEVVQLLEDGPSILCENLGNNLFNEVARGINNKTEKSINNKNSSQTVAIGDIDNDGEEDILEILDDLNYRLSFGSGDFDFRSIDAKQFLKLGYIQTGLGLVSAQLADFDNDGNLDLYISNYNYRDMIFKNDGAGRFTNVFNQSGIN